jgi:hypothetical protein
MKLAEVDAIVRSVIVHLGLPFSLLSVVESPTGWNIQVRSGTGAVIRFPLFDGRPVAMRVTIQERLESEF